MGLRERLTEAKLAGTKAEDGAHAYLFRDNETAALVAVDEVARWLRDVVDKAEQEAGAYEARMQSAAELPFDPDWLRALADSITGSTDGD